ncbi:MAG: ATP synthase F1 subunit delta [Verrucomicrobia bacterium]|jgi:F-type H+-transporting ATPase subunit delta|nr:ATP synthase F1 subunit delta [Verrucomicrobiota bacterium]
MHSTAETIEHYADALVAIAKAADALCIMEDDFVHLLNFMQESEELQRFLAAATVAERGKRRALHDILKGQTHPLLIEFLVMLLTAGDLRLLEKVATSFFAKASLVHERLSGEVHSAVPLAEAQVSEMETEVGRILNRQVTLRPRVIRSILGGVSIKVGDFVIDGTLDRQLEDARRQLLT